MKSSLQYFMLLFFTAFSFAQGKPETVYIVTGEGKNPAKPSPFFGQMSLSIPLRANPYRDEYYEEYEDSYYEDSEYKAFEYILPDGLGAHLGYGLHWKTWAGISLNTGIDWISSEKIVTAPVYCSVLFTPQIWENTNFFLQAGYGKIFAIGRGHLSGEYQKYRVGLIFDNHVSLYGEANLYGFPLHGVKETGSICVGISFFDFGL